MVTLKQLVGCCRGIVWVCLTIFVGLALKELIHFVPVFPFISALSNILQLMLLFSLLPTLYQFYSWQNLCKLNCRCVRQCFTTDWLKEWGCYNNYLANIPTFVKRGKWEIKLVLQIHLLSCSSWKFVTENRYRKTPEKSWLSWNT